MTKRHYLQSIGIFIGATFFVKHTFNLYWTEAIMTVVLAIVCVMHTIDVMRDIDRRKKRRNGNADSDPRGHITGPPTEDEGD